MSATKILGILSTINTVVDQLDDLLEREVAVEPVKKPHPLWRNLYDYKERVDWQPPAPSMGPGRVLGLDMYSSREICETKGREFELIQAFRRKVFGLPKIIFWLEAVPVDENGDPV